MTHRLVIMRRLILLRSDIQVWVNATSQIFNSIGIGFGSLIVFSSFNSKTDGILRDTLFIAIVNR